MEADSRGIYLHTARKCVSVAIGAVFLLAVAVAALRVCNSPASFNRRNVATTAEEFLANRPWLGQKLEHWQVRIAGTAKLPSYSDLAAFPVGNGTCFAIVGLHWPLATLSNIIGPGYQKRFGFLGTLIPWVRVAGRQVELPEQSVAWSAGGPAVVTSARHPQRIELDTFVCAPPDFRVIVVAASVANLSKAVQRNVELALTSSMPGPQHTRDGMLFERGTVRLRIGMLGAKGRVREGLAPEFPPSLDKRVRPLQPGAGHTVLYSLGTLRPGESVAKLIYLIFAENEQEETQALDALQKLQFSIFDGVAAAWKDWQGKVVEVGTAWPRLNEWLQAQEYILLAQRSSCGAFSPMHGYTYAWVRDSNGPLRFFSLAGATDLVRDHLEYHFRACASKGQVGNNVPLDLALPKSVVQPDWTKVPVEPAEVPSFAVLQHYWYYRVTGDLTLVRWHEGMLKRCIYGQALDRHKTLPFHGDETYRFPGYELFNAGRDINDWVCLETRSADSAFEFVAAAEALAEMLGGPEGARLRALAEQVRAATESLYWQSELGFYAPSRSDFAPTVHHYPFANINLRPLWVGYGKASDPRQAQNVLASLRYLWRGNGLVKTTPFCGYYVGMTPGYVVWNLAELRHPAVTKALKGMLDCAEGSGGYAEMIEPDDRPASEVWGLHRARPWEGGINAEAAIHAITGYEPDAPRGRASLRPLLVAGSSLRVRRLPLGNMAISFSLVESRPGHRVYRIEVEGPQPARASVDLAVVVWGSGLRLGRIEAKNSAQVHPAPGPSWPWAQELHIDGLEVTPDYPAVVSVSYTPAPATASLPTAVAFAYPQPNLPGGVRAIVVTPSADKVQEAQARYGSVWAVDTKIPWPPDYLRAALISSGRPRVASVILDVDGFPGAFKRREFWTKGEGRRIIDEYKNCGGRVENVLRPSPPPKPRAALPALSASPSHVTTTTQPEPLSSAPASADR